MRLVLSLSLLPLGLAAVAHASPEVPGAAQQRPVALVGGTVHPVSGPAIDGGTVVFEGGKITAAGRDVTIPDDAERVDVKGQHVYPGLIDANSQIGLVEVPSVRGSRDQAEMGLVNPNVRAEVAVNPDSELIPVSRSGGVLAALVVPSGGLINGTSACMVLDGWTWEDMCLRPGVGLHITWPRSEPIEAWWIEESASQQNDARDQALRTIRKALADARAYRAAKIACADGRGPQPDHDSRWEAMTSALEGKTRVFFAAEDIGQIQAALAFAQQEGLKPVIVGGYDAAECAPLLKKHGAPVIVGGVHRLPRRPDDAYDAPFTLPERLRAAGVPYCIGGVMGGASGSQPSNMRNLPYHAGTATAYGLPRDEALKSITLYAAQIMGVDDRLGSIEPGKDATLIVASDDILEIPARVNAAYIQGRAVSLSDRHKRLWEKYKEKYRRMGIQN
ncbi:MAG: amidohydrolase family protein [Pirellulales bacterium]